MLFRLRVIMPYLYKLKLLNGILCGREIKLKEGIVRLGSESEENDIVLVLDDGIEVVELNVQQDGVTLSESIPGIIGEQFIEKIDKLPLREPLMLAGIGMVIGHIDDDLSLFSQWRVPSLTPGAGSRFKKVALVLTGMLVITLFSMFFINKQDMRIEPKVNIQQQVERYKQQYSLKYMDFSWPAKNHLEINGWCQNENNLASLLEILHQHQIIITNNVICQDALLRSVTYAIQLYGYANFLVEPGEEHGEVIINGTIEDDERWQEVVKLLGTMPGLRKWNVVNQSETQTAQIIQLLKEVHLLGKLSISKSNRRIIISGKLKDKEVDTLNEVIHKYMLSNPDATSIIYQNIQNTGSGEGILPDPVISVGGNKGFPYIELSNGERLQKGAILPDGYTIRNIDCNDGIELSRQGELVHIPLGF